MKKLLLLLIIFICSVDFISAQSPAGFNYQGVARDSDNIPYHNTNIGIRISLIRDGISGTIDYSERHFITTTDLGVFNIKIGDGAVLNGLFTNLDWGNHSYYVKVDMDVNGGSNYENMGVSQLLSVPYALYADRSGSGGGGGSDEQVLSYDSNTNMLTISNGNSIALIGLQGQEGPQGPQGPAGTGVKIVGSVGSSADLNNSYGGSTGDMFISQNNGHGHVWNGSSWDDVGEIKGPRGDQGIQGTQGIAGPTGQKGDSGERGERGEQGDIGQQGPQGDLGQQGSQGPAGAGVQIVGSVGNSSELSNAYSGSTGDMFISQNNGHGHVWNGNSWDDVGQIRGPQGEQGTQGSQGIQGDRGTQGEQGSIGSTGPRGEVGSQGIQGNQGPRGDKGDTGSAGPRGDAGPQGVQGGTGDTGDRGERGERGERGDTGSQGSQGTQGPAGTGVQIIGSVGSAAELSSGYGGSVGDMFISQNNGHGHVWNGNSWDDVGQIRGPQGDQGPQGTQGSQGLMGNQGSQGDPGPQGTQGIQGPAGSYSAGSGISIAGGQISANDNSPSNELQTLSRTGSTIRLSDGGGSVNVNDGDSSPSNELQTLSVSGNNISLSNGGGSVAIPGGSYWSKTGSRVYYNGGAVGIGTASPLGDLNVLDVNSSGIASVVTTRGSHSAFFGMHSSGGRMGTFTNAPFDLLVNNDVKMHIGTDGRVGVGVLSPTADLDVADVNNSNVATIHARKNNARATMSVSSTKATFGSVQVPLDISTNGGSRIRVNLNGAVGIGTTAPGNYKLKIRHQSGAAGIGLNIENASTNKDWEISTWPGAGSLVFLAEGALRVWFNQSNGNVTSVSDRRLKRNIQLYDETIMNKISRLEPSKYEYRDNNPNNETSYGFIAQDVRKIFPHLVSSADGSGTGILGINYAGFGVIAIKAIQEQQKVIEEQANKIEQQEKKNRALEARLERLEKHMLQVISNDK